MCSSVCLEHRQQKSHFDTTQEVYGIKKQQKLSNVPQNALLAFQKNQGSLLLTKAQADSVLTREDLPAPFHRRYPGYPNDSLTCCLHLLQQHQLGIILRGWTLDNLPKVQTLKRYLF